MLRKEALQVRRLSILGGQYRASVSQYKESVELTLESKKSGDVYGNEFARGGLRGVEGLFDEPQQMFEFLVQGLESAKASPGGSQELDCGAEQLNSAGLTCHVWENDKGARVQINMRPQYAFMKPVQATVELAMIAYATIQQKIAIQLQTQAEMSQQLLTEQMVTFGRQVDDQRVRFENLVQEKLENQRAAILEMATESEAKTRALILEMATESQAKARANQASNDASWQRMETRKDSQIAEVRADMSALREALDELREGFKREADNTRQQLHIQLELAKAEIMAKINEERLCCLPKGAYYIHVKGGSDKGEVQSDSRRSPLRCQSPARRRSGTSKNTVTLHRVWTSGNLTEDELWNLFRSGLISRRRSAGKATSTPIRDVIEAENKQHRNRFADGKIGNKKLSSGSITPSGQLMYEFIFP